MTLKLKLFACLAILSAALLALAGAFYHTAHNNEAAFSTILVDRVEPLDDLKTVADTYAVLIVDNAHKALNGNIGYADLSDFGGLARRVTAGASPFSLPTRRSPCIGVEVPNFPTTSPNV